MISNPVELIIKKRDGQALTAEEIEWFFSLFHEGKLPEYQMSAMLMAMYFNPLNTQELSSLCHTMIHSGTVIDLSGLSGAKIDKHSTGGVGDKTSLILAPIVASLGVSVPMISGRGLGHTGGTLDKLESISGFNVDLGLEEFYSQLEQIGCALIGQTKDLAPLDKSLYALRDVTGTVESIPLIAASIMSKKIASGLDGLVLDVKTGNGAFMKSYDDAKLLAETLLTVAKSYNKFAVAFITDMSEPLGYSVGNWLEVRECAACLQGENVQDLMEVSLTLSGAMLELAGKCDSLEEGIDLSKKQIQNGQAFAKFIEIAQTQGGQISLLKSPAMYPKSKHVVSLQAFETGFISSINAESVGYCALELGAGRKSLEEEIDPKAGIVFSKKCGEWVNKGEKILTIHTDKEDQIQKALQRLRQTISIAPKINCPTSKIVEKITG